MRKNLLLRLCLMMSVILALHSCIHEELYSSSESASKEYSSKSLWKEDEKYIKNVMKVYFENEEEIKEGNGTPFWDYAMTMDHFDESFLMVPVVQSGKVVAVLKVLRKEKKAYFIYTSSPDKISFFQNLIFSRHKKVVENEASGLSARTECTTKTFATWMPDNESNPDPSSGSGHWQYQNVTTCKVFNDLCAGYLDENGNCVGFDGGGYDYGGGDGGSDPEEEEEDNPCDKIKSIIENDTLKQKLQALQTPANFTKNHEVGFFEKNGEFFPTFSEPCTDYVKARTSLQCLTGIMHTHQNVDCDGNVILKVPSIEDVMIFMQIPVVQAGSCGGNYGQAYSMTVTSAGTYILQYNGSSLPTNTNYDLDNWKSWIMSEYKNLTENQDSYSQNDIEKVFAKFIESCVGIDGLEVYKLSGNTTTKLQYDEGTDTISTPECN